MDYGNIYYGGKIRTLKVGTVLSANLIIDFNSYNFILAA